MNYLCNASFATALFGMSFTVHAADSKRLEVVREFIHELEVIHDLQVNATADNNATQNLDDATAAGNASLANSIRNGTSAKLQLRKNIYMLSRMKFTQKPYEEIIPTMVHWNKIKVSLFDEMTATAKIFLSGPKPNVDYGKLTSRMPEITAEMDFAEESIFKMTPFVFTMLIDTRPDKNGHASHLLVTRAEGSELATSLESNYGETLDKEGQNWNVSAAGLMHTYLLKKGFRFSDDPWE